ncbi:Ras guanine-nucleotide exchange factors catalytic domain [Trinorchestia longiramus]|nr:Ras guanine-nucleotide exchange factors catalytic domain [Trinorchestia longiramus]
MYHQYKIQVPSKESIETLSALELAEQMTYIDHQIFSAIRSEEFLKTAWMKADKQLKAANILLITKRFNDMSRLVVSEVIRGLSVAYRVTVIEKWVAVADICRCLHNFNGVLQVCAAFQNSSVFRLKKTWEKVSKTTRQTLDKLQSLVSSDGRFRSLRDALHRCDPPCIPYLGMYLTDLSFIEEGTPNFTEDKLLNFSKMRMIAHVIREIRHFQQTPYKIEHSPKVTNYLLDPTRLVTDDDLYKQSLELEPRRATLTPASAPSLAVLTSLQGVAAHLQQPKHDHKQDQKRNQSQQKHELKRQYSHHKETKSGLKQDPESPSSSRSPDFKDQPHKQSSLSKSDPCSSHDSPQDENIPPTLDSMTS